MWPVKIVSEMTYNVLSGTLSLITATIIHTVFIIHHCIHSPHPKLTCSINPTNPMHWSAFTEMVMRWHYG